ncbi:Cof-type HAD-IIB family hydrolase [Brachybacterium sp. YJGR34]|uniref:Cof-type HAD-IIB family hydrolase n=1 Tax=Brachybacterium sp. YJGR34 TaxID=2059911 RepID=UPI000E0ADAA4|nr:HAD family hydrolase [Brachybacterium sp. YJGR34]
MTYRLVATDLDGTLLHDDLSVSPRTRAALDAVRAAGVPVVPVTARQPEGVRDIAEQAGIDGWVLCSNGSLALHWRTGERLFEQAIAVEAQQELAAALNERIPGLLYASVRQGGEVFLAEHDYARSATYADHKRDPESMAVAVLEDVLAEPSLKLVVRHLSRTPAELLEAARELGVDGVELTHSDAPFLEVQPAGVTKASSLARLCEELGVDRSEVVAFGDAPNDLEMVGWAGHGVAVAGADAAVARAAAEVTGSNNADGVAQVLERMLEQGELG